MSGLNTEKRAQIIGCLCNGMSIRGIARMSGAAINTLILIRIVRFFLST